MKRMILGFTGATFCLLASWTQAGLIAAPSASFTSDKNDCSGFFGQGFENCQINGSSIIAKLEYDDGKADGTEVNTSLFSTVDGSEFSLEFNAGTDGSGTWSYSLGSGDPGVRYWTAKGGNEGFSLFFMVADALDGTCATDPLSIECLDGALPQTSGVFATPTGQALSHISFYNGGVSVPEPGSMAILGFGLLALGVFRRRVPA